MLELATPWVLLFLPLPLLLRYVVPKVPTHFPVALRIPFYQGLAQFLEGDSPTVQKRIQLTILGLVWSLLLLALAGPRWVGAPQPLAREGHNIMLCLDISGSMEVGDMLFQGHPVTRLMVVKSAAKQFVTDRVGDKIGLILFGARAYLQTPLTYDHQTVLTQIEDATVGLAGNSTSIGDALGLAIKRLENAPPEGRVIILLTDGVNNSGVLAPLKAAEMARDDYIKIYTIGLGSRPEAQTFGGIFLNINGATADLDEETLTAVAQLTGGRYFRANDMQSLHKVYQQINQMEAVKQEQARIRPQYEYYPWPLSIALLLLIGWLTYQRRVGTFFRSARSKHVG